MRSIKLLENLIAKKSPDAFFFEALYEGKKKENYPLPPCL